MRRRLDARKFHRLPLLRPVGGRDEVEDGAAVDGVAGIPLGADGDFALAVAVDVLRGDADVVVLREVLREDELCPRGRLAGLGCTGIAIPDELFLVGEQDVGRFVAVHIGDREAVADLDFVIERDGAELRLGWRGVERWRRERGGWGAVSW